MGFLFLIFQSPSLFSPQYVCRSFLRSPARQVITIPSTRSYLHIFRRGCLPCSGKAEFCIVSKFAIFRKNVLDDGNVSLDVFHILMEMLDNHICHKQLIIRCDLYSFLCFLANCHCWKYFDARHSLPSLYKQPTPTFINPFLQPAAWIVGLDSVISHTHITKVIGIL